MIHLIGRTGEFEDYGGKNRRGKVVGYLQDTLFIETEQGYLFKCTIFDRIKHRLDPKWSSHIVMFIVTKLSYPIVLFTRIIRSLRDSSVNKHVNNR